MNPVAPPSTDKIPLRSRVSRLAALVFVGVWAAGSVAVGASLMVGHWYTLPRPEPSDPVLVRALEDLRGSDRDRWLAVHVLYSECRCSRRILDHLLASPRPSWIAEHVLLVGPDARFERRAIAAGFAVDVVTPAELTRKFGIEAAPLLLVSAPDGSIPYCGGYTDRKQGLRIRDVEILESVVRGVAMHELPLYGCGVSQDLQSLLDPIGIKYQ